MERSQRVCLLALLLSFLLPSTCLFSAPAPFLRPAKKPTVDHIRLAVTAFLRDVRGGRYNQAYQRTSKAFRHHVGRDAFPAWLKNAREFADDDVVLVPGVLRMGQDCRYRKQPVVEVGACWNGEQLSRLIFVREGGGWKFDCVSTP